MKNNLNYRTILALLVCVMFVCSVQLTFTEPVSAASYKKLDSGKIKTEDATLKYTSYIKGKNNVYIKLTYKNQIIAKIYIDKGKTKVKYTIKVPGQKTQIKTAKHKGKSIKTLYKNFKKDMLTSN